VLALVLVDVAVLFGLLDVEGAVVAGMDVEQPGGRDRSELKNFSAPRCFPILAALLFDLSLVDIR
jgi:hypothetical protein